MRYSLAPVALAALAAANPVPQGVTQSISPPQSAPSDCMTSYSGTFNIQIVNVTDAASKRSIHKRQSQVLALTLEGGILKDSNDRTGYIAANRQFQFDGPPQTGAVYTAGWSVCPNGATERLTLGADDVFYSCLSGDFYNLYDQAEAAQCTKIYIDVIKSGATGGAQIMPDGQPTGAAVSQIPDGQVTGSAVAPVTQISDGQIQATSAVSPVQQITDGQIQATSAVSPVQQITDGQIQATSVAPVQQISDGQVQATSAVMPVQQISDGQIQATSAVSPVSQISDGQIQAPTGTAAPSGYMPSNSTMPYMPVQTGNGASALQLSSGLGLFAAIFGVALL